MKLPILFIVGLALTMPPKTTQSAIFSFDESDEMDITDEMEFPEELDFYDEMVSLNVSDRNQNLPDGVPWNEDCFPAFDEHMTGQVEEAIQDCPSYLVGKKLKFRDERMYLKKVPSAEECHILCFTFPECIAFTWSSANRICNLLKITVGNNLALTARRSISGLRTSCTENLDHEVVDYFSNPNQRHIAAKDTLSKAKANYDGEKDSRITYSKSLLCLPALLKSGEITEDELHTPSNFNTEEMPFLPLAVEPISKTMSITANSGSLKIPNTAGVMYKNWVITGLYAPPGKIINVRIPPNAVGQIKITIGVHTDKLYGLDDKLHRDPQISYNFDMTQETQKMGTPYGGLIVVKFLGPNDLSGESIDIEFNNVIEAPHFILGEHTNEDWNNHIKNRPAPWTVFEIPNSIIFIVATRKENTEEGKRRQIPDDVTTIRTNLEEWKQFMIRSDFSAGVVDRPVAEILVLDEQISVGVMHSGYPMMGKLAAVNQIFPPDGRSIDNQLQSVGIGHEIGHNLRQNYYYVCHVIVNMFFFYALPATRARVVKKGGRESRIFGFIKAGQPNALNNKNYDVWEDILMIPMDGPDGSGSGWEHDGSWDDLPAIIASYKDLPVRQRPANDDEKLSLWAEKVCTTKQMNMIKYFEFWQFPLSTSTQEACNQYTHEPTEIMAWIDNIKHLAEENDCQEGWSGDSNKCFKFTEETFTYDGAKEYCQALGGGSALASVSNRDDQVLVDWIYFQTGIHQEFWVENNAAHSTIFPVVPNNEYVLNTDSPTVLGTEFNQPRCHYGTTKEALDGTTLRCLIPFNKILSERVAALCEMNT